MNKNFISLCAGILLGVSPLFAVPAKPVLVRVAQPDGTVVTVKTVGDEFYHYKSTSDGIPVVRGEDGFYRYAELSATGLVVAGNVIARDSSMRSVSDKAYLTSLSEKKISQKLFSRRNLRKQQLQNNITRRVTQATAGDDVHGLVLLVQFSDKKFSSVGTQQAFDEMMNKEGYDYMGAIGSARDYFISQSGGLFQPTFDVVGPITLDNTMAYYGANDYSGQDVRPDEMVIDACKKSESTVDFTIYDRDNDGFVDLVYVIYAGYGESSDIDGSLENAIWPHAWYIYQGAQKRVSVDGKYLDAYACSAELLGNSGTTRDGIGTFCHEYSHTLGLPDFYDTSGVTSNYGMGTWSLMDYGCYNGPDSDGDGYSDGSVPVGYTAYEREFCGWITIEELTAPSSVTLENRQQTGWDRYMASAGLMIVKVDYDQSVWDYNTVNNESSRQRMTIMPADNKYSEYNEDGDLYPYNANTSFTDDSRPAAKTNTGLKLGKPVTNIAQDNGVITFDFMGGTPAVLAPVADVATHVTATGFTANWSSVENAASYTLQVDRKQPSAGGEILLSEDFSNCTADETTNIAGTTTFGNAKDGYFQTSGWSGKYLFPNIGKMKLGNSDNGGAVCTPAIDLSSCDGVFTVQFDASMFDGSKEKSVVIKVYVEGDESNAQSTEILSTSKMNTYTMTFTGGTADSKIVLMSTASSGKKRAYLDNIVIYSGEVLPEMASKQAVSDVWPLIVTGITDTSYQLVDLEPGYVYSYKVKAVTAEGEESDYSNVVKVDLFTGICDLPESRNRVYTDNGYIVVECETSQPVEVVNLTGQIVVSASVNGRSLLSVPVKGVYVVRCGTSVTRVVVK